MNRTTGLKNANDALKGRILEVSLADLQKDEDHSFRKVRLRIDEVQGKNCLTNFHGLDFTSDKLRSLVRKWQTLIEANVTVKTTDDYLIRLFAIAFTKRRPNQIFFQGSCANANSYYFDQHGDAPFRPSLTLEAAWRSARFDLDDYAFAA